MKTITAAEMLALFEAGKLHLRDTMKITIGGKTWLIAEGSPVGEKDQLFRTEIEG